MNGEFDNSYSVSGFGKIVNKVINTIFFYRLLLVTVALIILSIASYKVWNYSPSIDKYKNLSFVLGFGSVVIGIFYSILNYEHTQIKYRNDVKASRYTLSFNAACDWHRPTMVENLKITKKLYDENKHLIGDNRAVEFFNILEKDEPARSALVSIFNYLECIALGVDCEILDNEFMKKYFLTVFNMYNSNYGFYITHRRTVHNSPNAWINFTDLTKKWLSGK